MSGTMRITLLVVAVALFHVDAGNDGGSSGPSSTGNCSSGLSKDDHEVTSLLQAKTVFQHGRERSTKEEQAEREPTSLPTTGGWANDRTQWLGNDQLGRCINPEVSYEERQEAVMVSTWLHRLQSAATANMAFLNMPGGTNHAQSYSRNLMASVGRVLPAHRAVGLTTDSLLLYGFPGHFTEAFPGVEMDRAFPSTVEPPASRCESFDYSPAYSFANAAANDPYGCRLFEKSFSRLQAMKTCIVHYLDLDPLWVVYRNMAALAHQKGVGWMIPRLEQKSILKQIRACVKADTCEIFSSSQRADEMIKVFAFKDWNEVLYPSTIPDENSAQRAGRKGTNLQAWFASKVVQTASWYKPKDDGKPSKIMDLKGDTIDNLRDNCFKITVDSYAAMNDETKALQRSLVCQPLMYDVVEVPGAPVSPLTNGYRNFIQNKRDVVSRSYGNLANTPPVCGRAAAALAGYPQVHASGKPAYKEAKCLGTEKRRWKDCTNPKNFNCICFEKCWRAALRRVCELATDCCGDSELLAP